MCTIMKRQGPSLKYLEEVRPVLFRVYVLGMRWTIHCLTISACVA
jgi:hypothetical protein